MKEESKANEDLTKVGISGPACVVERLCRCNVRAAVSLPVCPMPCLVVRER
jgi:hypothetical protein